MKLLVLLVSFALWISLATSAFTDDLNVQAKTLYRGGETFVPSSFDTTSYAYKELAMTFTLTPDMPDTFAFHILCDGLGGFFNPTDKAGKISKTAPAMCTSNGVSVKLPYIHEDPDYSIMMNINIDGDDKAMFVTYFEVDKTGVTGPVTVSCIFSADLFFFMGTSGTENFYVHYDSTTEYTALTLPRYAQDDHATAVIATADDPAYWKVSLAGPIAPTASAGSAFTIKFSRPFTPVDNQGQLLITNPYALDTILCDTADQQLYTCAWTSAPSADYASYDVNFMVPKLVFSADNPVLDAVTTIDGSTGYGYNFYIDTPALLTISGPATAGVNTPLDFTFPVVAPADEATHKTTLSIASFLDGKLGPVCTRAVNGVKVVYATVTATAPAEYTVTYFLVATEGGVVAFTCSIEVLVPAAGDYAVTATSAGVSSTTTLSVINPVAVISTVIPAVVFSLDSTTLSQVSVTGYNGLTIPSGTTLTFSGLDIDAMSATLAIPCDTIAAATVSLPLTYSASDSTLSFTTDTEYKGCALITPGASTVSLHHGDQFLGSKALVRTSVTQPTSYNSLVSGSKTSAVVVIPQIPMDQFTSIDVVYTGPTATDMAIYCGFPGHRLTCAAFNSGSATCTGNLKYTGLSLGTMTCTFFATVSDTSTLISLDVNINSHTKSIPIGLASDTPAPARVLLDVADDYHLEGDITTMTVQVNFATLIIDSELTLAIGDGAKNFFADTNSYMIETNTPDLTVTVTNNKLTLSSSSDSLPSDGFYLITIKNYPIVALNDATDAVQAYFRISIAPQTLNYHISDRVFLPAAHSLTLSQPDPLKAKFRLISTQRQYNTAIIYPGKLFIGGGPVITGVTAPSSAVLITTVDGYYIVTYPMANIKNGEDLNLSIDLAYVKNYDCIGVCADAPSVLVSSTNSVSLYSKLNTLSQGAPFTVLETYGAFNTAGKGFVLSVQAAAWGSFPVVQNTFGVPADARVPVYSVTEAEVSAEPIGAFVEEDDELSFDPAQGKVFGDYISDENGVYTMKHVWAVPVLDAGFLLPTLADVAVEVSINMQSDNSLTISNGEPDYMGTPHPPASVVENAEFTMQVDFTSTHLNAITVAMGMGGIPATLDSCVDANDVDKPVTLSDGKFYFVELAKTDADTKIEVGKASYTLNCTLTASSRAVSEAATTRTIPVAIVTTSYPIFITSVELPAYSRGPTATTKITFDVAQDTLMTAKSIYAILKKSADLIKQVDNTFTIDRFLVIEQELVTPTTDMVVTDVSTTTVVLSAHFTGVTVAQADTLAATIAPALVQLGYSVTIRPADDASVPYHCETECGGEECGKCLDGRSCEVAEDCFSACKASVCASNTSAAIPVAIIAVVVVLATAMIM
jgi:hypothetical protein